MRHSLSAAATSAGLILLAALTLFVAASSGCKGGGGSPHPEPPPPVAKRFPGLGGYSYVNRYHELDAAGRQGFLKRLREKGHTATQIALVPWWGPKESNCSPKYGGGQSSAIPKEAIKSFIADARAYDILTVIEFGNWNGCRQRERELQFWRDALTWLIVEVGTDRVMIGGPAEPWVSSTSKAKQVFDVIRAQWTGKFMTIAKANGSASLLWAPPHDYADSHPCNESQLATLLRNANKKLIANTDCYPLVASQLGAARAASYTRQAIDSGSNFLVYGFDDTSPRYDVIDSMGAEIQR